MLHHKSFQEEKEEVVNQLRQEIQQISQAYKVRGTSWKSQLLICTVEPPNIGHFRAASFVLCKEVVLFERFKMYWNYIEKYFGVSSCVLCIEAVLILECPLYEILLQSFYIL